MKKSFLFLVVLIAYLFSLPLFSQTDNEPVALGLPGDNLNLYAVLDVFQKSKTLEEFERVLNEQDSKVNNLDLNNDGEIDYIEIESQKKGNTHVIVLQVAVNSKEKQDVAVIEVEKDKKNNVHVQIIGDRDLYGKNYIVEPSDATAGTPNPGYKGDAPVIVNNNTINNYNTTAGNPGYVTTNINVWPVVLYLFSPVYVVYRSPWYWGYYPSYWRPWRPVYYHDYWGYHGHYYRNPYYRRTVNIRNQRYYNNYTTRRNSSAVVRDYRSSGRYNATYNGRDYKRPAPVTNTRPTRPATTRPANPSTRPVTRPTNPTTRPTTRPVAPTNPSTRPEARPSRPVNRPTNPTTRPTTRPVTRPATRPAGNRSIAAPPNSNRGSGANRR
ncbi:hypothetical protein [Flavobacterium tructae]|uniref:EF-hand domain-containing protein n=1 Tax=Flavobacterium tructae TaxID=1114873 RepID=A0A1S1J4H4_9FLAO|nr:hypothetical protein [Flavobacterium tructae]OHT44379.1 hypothetical protein BHE19_11690 [Flavobacterium tructae]OXB19486.1 hypothetical protein B0A71_13185 [Flavobacterium tructae]